MSKHTLRTTVLHGANDVEIEVDITFSFTPGRPEVRYLRNGDPGYPAEPSQIEFVNCSRPGATKADEQVWLDELCRSWLETDEGAAQAEAAALADNDSWREEAAEMRRDS